MFDTIADMLRGSAPDDLAHALGTDRTQTRRAMEIGLPALITGLRDKTLEPGGALNLASMLDEPMSAVPEDIDAYLAAGDPSQGAALLDVAFGDRGEPALAELSTASGLSTRLLAQVMSVLAPLATGTVANAGGRDADSLRAYLGSAVEDLEDKGFGRVVELVSPGIIEPAMSIVPDDDIDAGVDFDQQVELDMDDSTVVEGAFPSSSDELIALDEFASIDPPDVDIDVPGDIDVPDAVIDYSAPAADFDTEIANVAPAGVSIEGGSQPTNVMLAEPDIDDDLDLSELQQPSDRIEGEGLSGMGWMWWIIGALLGLGILLFALSQCGGSDGTDPVATTPDTSEPAPTPTPDPLVAQRQATLDSILVDYPGVTGEVFGEVAVLDGTVADERERAVLDNAVREAGLGVQNNVTAQAAAAPSAAEGYALNDLIDAQPELSTLRALLDQAGLGDALAGGSGGSDGSFTLFAPTNDAFAAIQDQLAELQGDPDALQDVLLYHLVVGEQNAAAVSASSTLDTLLDGQTIAVDASSGSIVLNGNVPVLVGDATARNGVMHIVSGVLLPVTASQLPEEIGAELGLAPITFALGSSELTAEGQAELDKVAEFLLATPGDIEIGGHTDSDGDTGLNQTLSQDRADSVKAYLEAQGVPSESMTAVGFGEDQPIAPNDTPANKAMNRRIEFRPR
jgi:outer membrane protein OmpA-like peptidoglycan-associated protein